MKKTNYYEKYLKYKSKYNDLKTQQGGINVATGFMGFEFLDRAYVFTLGQYKICRDLSYMRDSAGIIDGVLLDACFATGIRYNLLPNAGVIQNYDGLSNKGYEIKYNGFSTSNNELNILNKVRSSDIKDSKGNILLKGTITISKKNITHTIKEMQLNSSGEFSIAITPSKDKFNFKNFKNFKKTDIPLINRHPTWKPTDITEINIETLIEQGLDILYNVNSVNKTNTYTVFAMIDVSNNITESIRGCVNEIKFVLSVDWGNDLNSGTYQYWLNHFPHVYENDKTEEKSFFQKPEPQ